MNAHKEILINEIVAAEERVREAEANGASFEEYRILKRKLEHLHHQMWWMENANGMIGE